MENIKSDEKCHWLVSRASSLTFLSALKEASHHVERPYGRELMSPVNDHVGELLAVGFSDETTAPALSLTETS